VFLGLLLLLLLLLLVSLQAGLVDELGGVSRAVELAKQLAGLPEDAAATQTVEWPPRWVTVVTLVQCYVCDLRIVTSE
jgi:hypothetical protein